MIPAFLLNPKVLEALAAVAIVAAYTGLIYYEGGKGPRAERDAVIAGIKAAQAEHERLSKMKEDASIAALAELEKNHEKALEANNDEWADFLGSLPRARSGSRERAEPVQEPTNVCGNSNDKRLSDAIQGYRVSLAESLQRLRNFDDRRNEDTAGLLKLCGAQAIDLIEWKEFGIKLRTINNLGAN